MRTPRAGRSTLELLAQARRARRLAALFWGDPAAARLAQLAAELEAEIARRSRPDDA